jgi:hypothetical protein
MHSPGLLQPKHTRVPSEASQAGSTPRNMATRHSGAPRQSWPGMMNRRRNAVSGGVSNRHCVFYLRRLTSSVTKVDLALNSSRHRKTVYSCMCVPSPCSRLPFLPYCSDLLEGGECLNESRWPSAVLLQPLCVSVSRIGNALPAYGVVTFTTAA